MNILAIETINSLNCTTEFLYTGCFKSGIEQLHYEWKYEKCRVESCWEYIVFNLKLQKFQIPTNLVCCPTDIADNSKKKCDVAEWKLKQSN